MGSAPTRVAPALEVVSGSLLGGRIGRMRGVDDRRGGLALAPVQQVRAQLLGVRERDRADPGLRLARTASGRLHHDIGKSEQARRQVGSDIDSLDPCQRYGAPLLDQPPLDDDQIVVDHPEAEVSPVEPGETCRDKT